MISSREKVQISTFIQNKTKTRGKTVCLNLVLTKLTSKIKTQQKSLYSSFYTYTKIFNLKSKCNRNPNRYKPSSSKTNSFNKSSPSESLISFLLIQFPIFSYKRDALEYEKELEDDNEYKQKEIEKLQKKLETTTTKLDEYKKENNQMNIIIDREKVKRHFFGPGFILCKGKSGEKNRRAQFSQDKGRLP